MVAPFLPDADKLAAVRAALPALRAGIYLNAGSAGPLPAEVVAAMRELETRQLETGRAHPRDWEDLARTLDEARAAVAAVVGASLEAVALTHSATDGLNAVIGALDWHAGDRVVTTNQEHVGCLGPLVRLRDRLAIDLTIVDAAEAGRDGDDERFLASLDEAIRPGTRLVAVSHVLWTTGAVLPIARIVELAHAHGALVLVDGAQAAGAIPVDVEALGADAYALSGHKWLLGPEGMGGLYVAPAAIERLDPVLAGWLSFKRFEPDHDEVALWPGARRFESTGFHGPSVVGFARACGWLSMFVGLDWIHRRGAALARDLAGRLAAIPGVTVVTPPGSMATLVTFRIDGWTAATAADELAARSFAIIRTIDGLDAIRASVGAWNDEAELATFSQAVGALAGHTPETLPPRRLTVLGGDLGGPRS